MNYPPGPYGPPPQGQWLPPPGAYGGYPQPPPRPSSIPTVVGILMICFSGLGLLVTLVAMLKTNSMVSSSDVEALGDAGKKFRSYHMIEQTTYLLIGILHMVAGILCVMRKRVAPTLAILY